MARTKETAGVDGLNGSPNGESAGDPRGSAFADLVAPPPASIIPPLPSAPDPATSLAPFQIADGTTYTLDAGASVYSDAATQGAAAGFDVWGSLANFGTIWSQSAVDAAAVALSNVGSTFTNDGIVVHGATRKSSSKAQASPSLSRSIWQLV